MRRTGLLAWLFGTNTVLAVLLQVPAARGVNTVSGSLRAARLGDRLLRALLRRAGVTHDTIGWVTIALVWLGHVTVTGAELFQSAATLGLHVRAVRPGAARRVPRRRAASAARSANILGARRLHLPGDRVGHPRVGRDRGDHRAGRRAGMHPAARSAERFLATHSLDASARAA